MPRCLPTVVKLTEFVEATRQYHLTIEKVLALPIDEPVRFFCMDRNLGDLCPETTAYTDPVVFFHNAYFATFTRLDGISGKWWFDCQFEADYRPFDVDISDTESVVKWVHLETRDLVPCISTCFSSSLAGVPWTALEPTRRLGWRGPIMLKSDLAQCPLVYFDDYI